MTTVSLPFFGGELTSFLALNNMVSENTSTIYYNATYSRCALTTTGYYALASSPSWSAASTFWMHCVVSMTYGYPSNPSGNVILFYNGATVVAQVVAVSGQTTYTLQLQTLQAGVMTNVGSAQTFNTASGSAYLYTLDFQLVAGASGSAQFYVNGSSVASGSSLNHSAWSGVTQIVLGSTQDTFINSAATFGWSQIICDTTSTLGRYLITDQFDTESATNTGWSGYGGASKLADINEVPLDDTTYIQAGTTGLIDTFYQSTLSLGSYYILGRGVAVRARQQDSGPANIKLAIRGASANYTSSQFALTAGFQPVTYMWTTNPATSGSWTPTTASAIELGVQSQT